MTLSIRAERLVGSVHCVPNWVGAGAISAQFQRELAVTTQKHCVAYDYLRAKH